ncbi:conserved hypothetical protein [Talaromyces stipitatus ATCC 10500]|uniref:Protein PBN1 n=1 Tax=Talaromyces stipitatus (strain ATCC 10500 / CBS 375.48 / QM 6759 / NRRL 1006) TaxID=441959 RepID=B8MBT0_TALSN|nr:uncharacterized protein TSTA_119730 [Talaromyces stipitatus ATCC 10500]EED18213.1 conserved hypothetical protein [Talaromyces stipitatus ATCC 10500]
MKRRITYITAADAEFDPSKQAILSKDTLSIRGLDAAKEERFTFNSAELPTKLLDNLHHTRELHIRWSTERNYDSVAPFLARISPGLQVYHISSNESELREDTDRICPLVQNLFGDDIKCISQKKSFSEAPVLVERLSSLSAQHTQFHHNLPSIDRFVQFIRHSVCDLTDVQCADIISSLSSADSIAIDYDATADTITLSAFWSQPLSDVARWTEDINVVGSSGKVEVGLLSNEKSIDAEDLTLGGYLAVVGQDSKLKHATYVSTFETPTGLHPTMKISISPSALVQPSAPEDTTCALHTYLTLPSTIFADKYQLSTKDHLFLNSHHLKGLRAVSGETDLEAPDWVLPSWGSNLLIEIATPIDNQSINDSDSWDVTIPLHLRYLKPSESGYRPTSIPWPIVFWACSAEDTEMGINPFDRVDLGYDKLFPPKTYFYHLHPGIDTAERVLMQEIQVPVLRAATEGGRLFGDAGYQVELGTVAAILIGFTWVLWKLVSSLRSGPRNSIDAKKRK